MNHAFKLSELKPVVIDFGTGTSPRFVPNGKKRYVITDDYEGGRMVMVNMIVKANDGTLFYALGEFDETSSGEHCGTGIFTPRGLAFQDEKGFLDAIGKKSEDFFPYRYRYAVNLQCDDIHIDDTDGWSV